MNISNENKKIIVDEIKFVLKSMKESDKPIKIIYYFSAIYGMLQRIYNIEYNQDLVVAYVIMKMTHDSLRQNILNQDPIIQLDQKHFDNIYQLSEKFCEKIENGQNFDDVLKQFVILTYSISGNGYYLSQKGFLKV